LTIYGSPNPFTKLPPSFRGDRRAPPCSPSHAVKTLRNMHRHSPWRSALFPSESSFFAIVVPPHCPKGTAQYIFSSRRFPPRVGPPPCIIPFFIPWPRDPYPEDFLPAWRRTLYKVVPPSIPFPFSPFFLPLFSRAWSLPQGCGRLCLSALASFLPLAFRILSLPAPFVYRVTSFVSFF